MSRLIKQTIDKNYYGNIKKLVQEIDRLAPDRYKVAPKAINSNEVTIYLKKHPSKLISSQVPEKYSEENSLPRSSRHKKN